jgi:outer membrane lipoprotein-sorting protein
MKKSSLSSPVLLLAEGAALAIVALAGLASAAANTDLQAILAKMDQAAANFHSAQASFTWKDFNSVVNSFVGNQQGKIYFRKNGSDVKMAADVDPPEAEQVVFSKGEVQIFRPKIGTVDVYNAGAHRDEVEAFLVLGFGSSGQEMQKSFDVNYAGDDKVEGVDTAKLELTPKSESVKQHFPKIILWIDPQKGVSVQQQLFESGDNYRLATYTDIRINQKFSDKVFNLKKTGGAKVVSH